LLSDPRSLVFRPEQLERPGLAAFLAGQALSRIAGGSIAAAVLAPEDLFALIELLGQEAGEANVELRGRFTAVLPRRARKELERVIDESVRGKLRPAIARWQEEEQQRALRAGLLFGLDLRDAAEQLVPQAQAASLPGERRALLGASPLLTDLLHFAA